MKIPIAILAKILNLAHIQVRKLVKDAELEALRAAAFGDKNRVEEAQNTLLRVLEIRDAHEYLQRIAMSADMDDFIRQMVLPKIKKPK